MPILIPGEQITILLEAFREILLTKALENIRIRGIGLTNKLRRCVVKLFFLPVNCDLSFGHLKLFFFFLCHSCVYLLYLILNRAPRVSRFFELLRRRKVSLFV